MRSTYQVGLRIALGAALVIALGGACLRTAKYGPSGADVVRFDTSQRTLPSGLRVVIENDRSSGLAGVVLTVGSGAADDPPGREGLAHLVEHLVFRSSRQGVTFWARLMELGAGVFNGSTSMETTTYYAFVPKPQLSELVQLFSEAADDPLAGITDEILNVERGVVQNERRLRDENGRPGEVIGALYKATFPPGHPYSRNVGGSNESLQAMTLADAKAFVAKHYQPQNMTLVVAGAVDQRPPDSILQGLSSKLRGGARMGPVAQLPSSLTQVPNSPPAATIRMKSAIASPQIWVGWALPSTYGPEGARAELAALFARGITSDDWRRSDPDIASLNVMLIPDAQASLLVAVATLNTGENPEKSIQSAVLLVRKGAAYAGFLQHMVSRVQMALVNDLAFDTEDVTSRAAMVAEWSHFTGDPQYFYRWVSELRAPSRDDIVDFATRYINEKRAHVIYVEPLPTGFRPPPGPVGFGAHTNQEMGVTLRDRQIESVIPPSGLSDARRFKLRNGLEVVLLQRSGSPFWSAALGFRDGPLETCESPCSAAAACPCREPPGVIEAAQSSTDMSYSSSLILYGMQPGFSASTQGTYQSLRSSSDNLERGLRFLGENRVLLSGRWPPLGYERSLQAMQARENRPEHQVLRKFDRLFATSDAENATLDQTLNITLKQIRDHSMFFHRPDQALLVVVGDFTLDAVKTQAERWFGDWRPTPTHLRRQASLPRRQLDVPEKDRILLAQRPGATQTTVQMGCLLPQMTPDKQALYDVFAAFVGGDLFEELRWKIGATYNVGGGVSVAWDGTTKLEARTDIETARLQEALEILLRRWRRAPIAGSFNRLRWDAGRSFATRFTTSSDFAQAIFEAWIRRWPIAILDDYPKQLSRLSPSELEPLIRSCRDTTAIALIGDKAIAWAAYQAANRALEAPEPQPPQP